MSVRVVRLLNHVFRDAPGVGNTKLNFAHKGSPYTLDCILKIDNPDDNLNGANDHIVI